MQNYSITAEHWHDIAYTQNGKDNALPDVRKDGRASWYYCFSSNRIST